MEFKITKEQILELVENNDAFTEHQLQQWFPEAFKPVLEIGKWYKLNLGNGWICFNYQGKESCNSDSGAYGFTAKGHWYENLGVDSRENNIPATKEEVFEMLKKEAEKRGFEEWVYIKRNFNKLCEDTFINPYTYPEDDLFFFSMEEDYMEMNGFVIYSKGQWAEIIPTITKQEAEQKLNCKIV